MPATVEAHDMANRTISLTVRLRHEHYKEEHKKGMEEDHNEVEEYKKSDEGALEDEDHMSICAEDELHEHDLHPQNAFEDAMSICDDSEPYNDEMNDKEDDPMCICDNDDDHDEQQDTLNSEEDAAMTLRDNDETYLYISLTIDGPQ